MSLLNNSNNNNNNNVDNHKHTNYLQIYAQSYIIIPYTYSVLDSMKMN